MSQVDVAVIGAGPAGIAAALAAADAGANTLLVDEGTRAGGHLRWRISLTLENDPGFGLSPAVGPEFADQLVERIQARGNLELRLETVAWGLFDDNLLGLSSANGAKEITAGAIVIATGSTDLVAPFPGWTLPGVMTARAAQIFIHVHRVLPGRAWAILGDSHEADELQRDLELAGATVVVRANDPETLRASGTNRLAHAEVGDDVYELDALAIALGRQPDAELALQAMAEATFSESLGGFTTLRDQDCETSAPDVFIAGDAAGIGSLAEIVAEGRLAGLAAAGADAAKLADARAERDAAMSNARAAALEELHLRPAGA